MYIIFKQEVDLEKFYAEEGHFMILKEEEKYYEVIDNFTPMMSKVLKTDLDGKFVVIEKEEYEEYEEKLEQGWNKEISEFVEEKLKKYKS